ncbi:MAG TPA: hypothetical protein DEB46_04745 [Myxococcales bacterium]|nr:hypothetical protein [Myxococcales bacterium]
MRTTPIRIVTSTGFWGAETLLRCTIPAFIGDCEPELIMGSFCLSILKRRALFSFDLLVIGTSEKAIWKRIKRDTLRLETADG